MHLPNEKKSEENRKFCIRKQKWHFTKESFIGWPMKSIKYENIQKHSPFRHLFLRIIYLQFKILQSVDCCWRVLYCGTRTSRKIYLIYLIATVTSVVVLASDGNIIRNRIMHEHLIHFDFFFYLFFSNTKTYFHRVIRECLCLWPQSYEHWTCQTDKNWKGNDDAKFISWMNLSM